MGKTKNYSKEVKLQYPFVDNFTCKNFISVYSFDKETITKVVNEEITCANYHLGQVQDDKFYVFYIGRVTGEALRQRLLEHLDEYNDHSEAYFNFVEQESDEDAYQQECKDFHTFQDIDEEEGKKYFRNMIHPARPSGSTLTCKICGK